MNLSDVLNFLIYPSLIGFAFYMAARMDKNEKSSLARSEKLSASITAELENLQAKHESNIHIFYEKREMDIKQRGTEAIQFYKDFVLKEQYNSSNGKFEGVINQIFDELRNLSASVNQIKGKNDE